MAKAKGFEWLTGEKEEPEKEVKAEEVNKSEDLMELNNRLNDAANLLLEQFTPVVREFTIELAEIVLKIPRWQLVCGSLLAQFEGGCLAAPSLDPGWSSERRLVGVRKCEECGELFEPFKPFQKYCTNKCGTLAAHRVEGEKKSAVAAS
jgi:hypothetical protein